MTLLTRRARAENAFLAFHSCSAACLPYLNKTSGFPDFGDLHAVTAGNFPLPECHVDRRDGITYRLGDASTLHVFLKMAGRQVHPHFVGPAIFDLLPPHGMWRTPGGETPLFLEGLGEIGLNPGGVGGLPLRKPGSAKPHLFQPPRGGALPDEHSRKDHPEGCTLRGSRSRPALRPLGCRPPYGAYPKGPTPLRGHSYTWKVKRPERSGRIDNTPIGAAGMETVQAVYDYPWVACICGLCHFWFTRALDLRAHHEAQQVDEPLRFRCTKCDSLYRMWNGVATHYGRCRGTPCDTQARPV
ncbi:hypothetical protein J6590_000709 [Homalodisca vitripennis]|nr:hypothetical protein J6590_000709 [Homalodisca vitripennis]